jgi:hypothetical protein
LQNSISSFDQKKRKRIKTKFSEDTIETRKLGRKRRSDYTKRKHSKYSYDNIIKKVKLFLLKNALNFLNNILNNFLNKKRSVFYAKYTKKTRMRDDESNNLLKPLDYKYVYGIKKQSELSIFRMQLKEIFSKDISPKYKTFSKASNKIIIDEVLENEKDNEIIMFTFNLTFKEWLDIFLFKKELKSNRNFNEDKMKDLINIFNHFDVQVLDEMYIINNNKKYLSAFIFLIYNYERYFSLKKGRNRVSKKK